MCYEVKVINKTDLTYYTFIFDLILTFKLFSSKSALRSNSAKFNSAKYIRICVMFF